MKIALVSALALGALSSTAFAEPVKLTHAQMDSVTAGDASWEVNNYSATKAALGSSGRITGDGSAEFSGSSFTQAQTTFSGTVTSTSTPNGDNGTGNTNN